MKKGLWHTGTAVLACSLLVSACGGTGDKKSSPSNSPAAQSNHSVAIVTDIEGVDDRSFNQGAWEGLQQWGKKNNIKKGTGGFNYFQSNDASQYASNLDEAASQNFKTIFGVGYLLENAVIEAAKQNTDKQYVLIDSEHTGLDNAVSASFKDNEAAYLAGFAAAYTTGTNHVGFIGGEEGKVIDRFEAGYVKGVQDAAKELKKEIKIDVQYAASFGDAAKGKALAAAMYKDGVDIIYHASGGTGAGIFKEAKDLNKEGSDNKVWVIGVDSDQHEEGNYTTKDGKQDNCTLLSTLKGVGAVVQDISNRALKDKFPGGKNLTYGIKDGGVSITKSDALTKQATEAIEKAKQNVSEGKVEVPEKPSK